MAIREFFSYELNGSKMNYMAAILVLCRRMATTQFEAYGARQAFPCFDEPRFKTNYTFTLGRPSNLPRYTTIANGALKEAGVPQ